MKKLFSKRVSVLLLFGLLSCKGPAAKEKQPAGDIAHEIELIVDGAKKNGDPAAIVTSAYAGAHFMCGYMSEKEDIQFSISAFMQELKPGTYQVYDCKSASECDENTPDNNQIAMYGPYPKDPMPALNLFRIAYYAPKLGLKPLTLVITSVKDEQQAGNPFKSKRIEGEFSGDLANVEQEKGSYEWHVEGKTTQVKGSFSVLCSMR